MKLKNSIKPLKQVYKDRLNDPQANSRLHNLTDYMQAVRAGGFYKEFNKRIRWDLWWLLLPHRVDQERITDYSAQWEDVDDQHIYTLLTKVFSDKFIDDVLNGVKHNEI